MYINDNNRMLEKILNDTVIVKDFRSTDAYSKQNFPNLSCLYVNNEVIKSKLLK